ncbi:deoxyhypusine synthase family protein [Candidatus Palauibacter sp.]|uniref:deoxyhypusine synthase family protein n=1 Tax=Candidatus Palauibacter sp. TaxID=3101350 RepID=UPI003B5A1440
MTLGDFIDRHYRHFNAAALREAARAYRDLIDDGGQMLVTLAGAMSTAELGLSLAEMIRAGKVHTICATGANVEEDLFNLVAHDHYQRIPDWRALTATQEQDLERRGLNRVTDTCIPEAEAFRAVEAPLRALWRAADGAGERRLPHEYLYLLIRERTLADSYQIDPADSWLVAAAEADLPMFVPGWEDSTLGNFLVAKQLAGDLGRPGPVLAGTEYMAALAEWYARTSTGCGLEELPEMDGALDGHRDAELRPDRDAASDADADPSPVGFFQIGGGIAGDFPISVVPMIRQDLRRWCPCWAYFCQISDSTTSYGSYSGAVPNEKITWGKLDVDTPKFVIESDATIVAPLVFGYVLGW